MNATQLANGTRARLIRINGGLGMTAKLTSVGIIPGSLIEIKRRSLMRGPVVIRKGASQIAIGFRMAHNLIVEPLDAAG